MSKKAKAKVSVDEEKQRWQIRTPDCVETPPEFALREHEHAEMASQGYVEASFATLVHREALAKEIQNVRHSLRAEFRGAVRSFIGVMEAGHLNSEQVKAIHALRVIIGDSHGTGCRHETSAYEEGDVLVCLDCREAV